MVIIFCEKICTLVYQSFSLLYCTHFSLTEKFSLTLNIILAGKNNALLSVRFFHQFSCPKWWPDCLSVCLVDSSAFADAVCFKIFQQNTKLFGFCGCLQWLGLSRGLRRGIKRNAFHQLHSHFYTNLLILISIVRFTQMCLKLPQFCVIIFHDFINFYLVTINLFLVKMFNESRVNVFHFFYYYVI
jgi:hypothetical protein